MGLSIDHEKACFSQERRRVRTPAHLVVDVHGATAVLCPWSMLLLPGEHATVPLDPHVGCVQSRILRGGAASEVQ